jgi:hypothetical protein
MEGCPSHWQNRGAWTPPILSAKEIEYISKALLSRIHEEVVWMTVIKAKVVDNTHPELERKIEREERL